MQAPNGLTSPASRVSIQKTLTRKRLRRHAKDSTHAWCSEA
jgi:hypothetical protein